MRLAFCRYVACLPRWRNGRRRRLKIFYPFWVCGFDSRSRQLNDDDLGRSKRLFFYLDITMLNLDELNAPQKQAVTYHGNSHSLILAGAGSGKTRVLTYRIAWLLSQGYGAGQIIAFTFTNKAAREMRERAMALMDGNTGAGVMLSTFHAYGARFLHRFGGYAGLEPGTFSIYDESDQKSLLKLILREAGFLGTASQDSLVLEPKRDAAVLADFHERIQAWKEKGVSVERAKREACMPSEVDCANIYETYERRLLENNAVDFAGLLLWPLSIIRNHARVREEVQSKYLHILVDEFQDTNGVQLDLLEAMCGKDTCISAVGDDDQSIYAWRGADPTAILEFEARFGHCEVFKLEQNYRSTKPILSCAAGLIAHNRNRTQKTLWTETASTEPVHLVAYDDDREEQRDIIETIRQKRLVKDMHWGDFAILFRTNNMSVGFERECAENGIPYRLVASVGFFQREEIVDLMCYLKLVVNPLNQLAFRRVINKPVRGIGEKSAAKILDLAQKKALFGVPVERCLLETLRDISDGKCKIARANARFLEGCREFYELFEKLQDWRHMQPKSILSMIIDETHFDEYLKKNNKLDEAFADARLRVQSLLDTLESFQSDSDSGLDGFIETMSLVTPEEDQDSDCVKLMTIHAAKGLEFDTVFIAGAEQGILPLERGGICDIEEERRLMYVAITRARRALYISHAENRLMYGHVVSKAKSCFFDELVCKDDPNSLFEFQDKTYSRYRPGAPKLAWGSHKKEQIRHGDSFCDEVGEGMVRPIGRKRDKSAEHDAIRKDFEDVAKSYASDEVRISQDASTVFDKSRRIIQIGSHVSHSIHGDGTVVKIEKTSHEDKVTVNFAKSGQRTIIARFLAVKP